VISALRTLSFAVPLFACAPSRPVSVPAVSAVQDYPALPPGYRALAELELSCEGVNAAEAYEDRSLLEIDCSVARLTRLLRAEVAAHGGTALVGLRCEASGTKRPSVHCRASAAAPQQARPAPAAAPLRHGPAPPPEVVHDLDDPAPLESARVRLSAIKLSSAEKATMPARAHDAVGELAYLPPNRRAVAQLSARCDACAELSLRYALRVAAGRGGASELLSVRCFEDGSSRRCIATATRPWSF
jgi:hypothetical protein